MRIDIKRASIRIDNHEKGYYSVHLGSPFNCFVTIDFSKAKVIFKKDGKEEACQNWRENDVLFKKVLFKIAHETNGILYANADIEGYIEMQKDGPIAIIEILKMSFAATQLEKETPWEKRERESIEEMRKYFPKK